MSAIASWTVFCDAVADEDCHGWVGGEGHPESDTLTGALDLARERGWDVIDRYNTICPVCTLNREEKSSRLRLIKGCGED